jgi:hypothetical protein
MSLRLQRNTVIQPITVQDPVQTQGQKQQPQSKKLQILLRAMDHTPR